jgi:hypothetical protein
MSEQDDTPRRGRRSNEEIWQEGYEAGYQAALKTMRPSLMDACKRYARTHWRLPDEELRDAFEQLYAEYGERLSDPDVQLVLAVARRERTRASAPEEAIRSLVRPQARRREVIDTAPDIVIG